MKKNELKEMVEDLRPRVAAQIRMNQWIVEVSRRNQCDGGYKGYLDRYIEPTLTNMRLELSEYFESAERTRERDEQIARCYSDELRPPDDDGDDWRENLEKEIEDRIGDEIVKIALYGPWD